MTPDLWRGQERPADAVLWDMVDGPMPRGLLGIGDPDVHSVDGRWTMYLGGFSTTFRNRLYCAILEPGADLATGRWILDVTARGRVAALTTNPPRGAWDRGGQHTPSWVPAVGEHPERIYYTGRATSRQYGPRSQYSIGVLERREGSWVRRDAPLVVGDERRPSVLEPLVVHDGNRYVMWYQANPHEIGPGDLPDYELRCAWSEDGLDWSEPVVFAGPAEGFFDNTVVRHGDGWLMVLARGGDLHATGNFPEQGLWCVTASSPSPDRGDWSEPVRLLDTDAAGTPSWCARGTYGPGAAVPDPDGPRVVVFGTGVREEPSWPRLTVDRLRHFRRPPVPSPFYLTVGALTVDVPLS